MNKISYGQQLLHDYLKLLLNRNDFEINYRPNWLDSLEIDIYCDNLRLAIEFNGDHHYRETSYCINIKSVRFNDKKKKQLCKKLNIKLVIIDAVDLEYTRLCGKIGFKEITRQIYKDKEIMDELRKLNNKSTEYRKTLKNISPLMISVYRKHTKTRKAQINKSIY